MNLYAVTVLVGPHRSPSSAIYPAEDRDSSVAKAINAFPEQEVLIDSVLQLQGFTDEETHELLEEYASPLDHVVFSVHSLIGVMRLQRLSIKRLSIAYDECLSALHALSAALGRMGLRKFSYKVIEEGTGVEHPHAHYAHDRETAVAQVEELVRTNYPANSTVFDFHEQEI